MYSTQFNISVTPLKNNDSNVVGKYSTYPRYSSKRIDEGGMRLEGKYKSNDANNPLVSVITTVFNRELVIEKAICSVLNQTYSNIEYIIIDGASHDGTLEIIKKYVDVIDYYVSEPDSGLYEGMNKGLELAHGEYLIILNSDDWYREDCIETLIKEAQTKKLELVCALATEVDDSGKVIRNIPMMPFGDNVRLRMPLRHETMLVTKSLYDRVGLYDQSYKIIGDLKLTQRMYEAMVGFSQMSEYLMCFRKIGVASQLNKEFVLERKRLLLEQFTFLKDFELELLANEYKGDPLPYSNLVKKYSYNSKFVKSVKEFLRMHGVNLSA